MRKNEASSEDRKWPEELRGLAGVKITVDYQGGEESETPAFEVAFADGHRYRVFASGKVEGFDGHQGNPIIINRIPLIASERAYKACQKLVDAQSMCSFASPPDTVASPADPEARAAFLKGVEAAQAEMVAAAQMTLGAK